jgi:hypothetical protein
VREGDLGRQLELQDPVPVGTTKVRGLLGARQGAGPGSGGAFYPARVSRFISVEDEAAIEAALDDDLAWSDDAYWRRFVDRRFTWERYMTWWVARRFVVPRDVTRR